MVFKRNKPNKKEKSKGQQAQDAPRRGKRNPGKGVHDSADDEIKGPTDRELRHSPMLSPTVFPPTVPNGKFVTCLLFVIRLDEARCW